MAMRVEYTAAVSLALSKAARWAARDAAAEVQPRHLVQGLIHEEEGRAAVLLALAGVDTAAIREELPQRDDADVPLSLAVRAALHDAAEIGQLLSAEGTVTTEQVLLALVRADADVRGTLQGLGLDFARLEREVLGPQTPLALDEPLDLGEPREQMDLARILDASANRAREALRVLEDYARFALDDAGLTRALKELRHGLAAALEQLPDRFLLAARDTDNDVGTAISTPREHERFGIADVVETNAKRLQEALRSLEEFGKVVRPEFGQAIEAVRYRAYTLESSLALGAPARQRLADARLYVLVTESQCRLSLAGTVTEVLAGGAQIIQLREKGIDDRTLLEKARDLRRLTRAAGALFIVNDRPDIAVLSEADGVHLGQDDLPVREARHILGARALIGVSTHNIEQVRQAVRDGASYIGVGPTFASGTKQFAAFPGLEFVRAALAETSLPVFVIGGVTRDNLPAVQAAGGRRVAVSQAVCQADDPRQAAAALRKLLSQ
jgi:thiamine-phosphate pyrophosphorylase